MTDGKHKISWLNIPGYIPTTWNPIVGCTKVSSGCDNCYAERMANRLTGMLNKPDNAHTWESYGAYSKVINNGHWNGETAVKSTDLNTPLKWRKPHVVFVCSMGDLFHESVSSEWIKRVLNTIEISHDHIFIILTKRPENISKMLGNRYLPSNVWLGVTAENQEQANKRIPILLSIPAAKRFVSIEPMLGPVDFYDIIVGNEFYNTLKGFGDISGGSLGHFGGTKLDWVICGGESGPGARPMHPDWVRSVRDQCQSANVPFFFKQWGEWLPIDHADCDQFWKSKKSVDVGYSNTRNTMLRVGRTAAGDLLDDKQYHEFPNK